MAYEAKDGSVFWGGKKLKGLVADDFSVLSDPRFARAGGVILFLGKPVDCTTAQFQILNSGFAKDDARVWQIQAKRLKELPNADVATFEAVGDWYGRDAVSIWHDGKVIKKADVATFKAHGRFRGSDAYAVFHQTKRLFTLDDKPLDAAALKLIGDEQWDHLEYPIIAHDGVRCFLLMSGGLNWWHEVETQKPDNVRFLGDDPSLASFDDWLTDEVSVFWYGKVLPGAGPGSVKVWSRGVASTNDAVFLGVEPQGAAFDATSFMRIGEDYYADKDNIWELDCWYSSAFGEVQTTKRLICPRENTAIDADAAVAAFIKAAIEYAFAMFDLVGIEGASSSSKIDKKIKRADLPLQISVDGAMVTVSLKDDKTKAPVSSWYRIASTLWGAVNEPGLRLRCFERFPGDSGFGFGAPRFILERVTGAALMAAEGLRQAGHAEEAHALAAQRLLMLFSVGNPELSTIDKWDIIARIDPALLAYAAEDALYHQFQASTYLAGARLGIASAHFAGDDISKRWATACFLCYMAVSTSQYKHFSTEIAAAIIHRIEAEETGFVRDQLLVALDAIARFSDSWFGQADALKPALELLISEGVNIELNRRRLAGENAA